MDLLIAGTGALACLFAAKLTGSGNNISMMGSWPEGLAALRKNGVTLHDLDGDIKIYPVNVMNGSEGKLEFSNALVLVKSWQTERVAKQLERYLSAEGMVLTLQNGLGNDEVLINTLGANRVLLGVTMVGARLLGPGEVQYTGNGKVFLGNHPGSGELAETLKNGGFQLEVVSNTVSLLWGKLVINAAINPLTALLRLPNGELLKRPAAHKLLAEVAREAALVAERQGISLPYTDPVRAVEEVAQSTGSNYSSMLQDVLRGTSTEIEAINGAIVRTGESLGVPTPVNRTLWLLLKSLDYP